LRGINTLKNRVQAPTSMEMQYIRQSL